MNELESEAMRHGVADGHQMSRFLLWVGNECFEGRAPADFVALAATAPLLAKRFLAQDRDPVVTK